MFELDHIDEHGRSERWPAGRVYAEALARYAGYSGGAEAGSQQWYWGGNVLQADIYNPSVHGSVVVAKLFQPRRMVGLSLTDPLPGGILARMMGEPWDDEALFALIAHLRALPYANLVAHALIAQADWLDEHPEHRGLKIAQTTSRRRPQPAQLETGP